MTNPVIFEAFCGLSTCIQDLPSSAALTTALNQIAAVEGEVQLIVATLTADRATLEAEVAGLRAEVAALQTPVFPPNPAPEGDQGGSHDA